MTNHSAIEISSIAAAYSDAQFDLLSYDRYLIAMSGGKDAIASLLTLIDAGVPREKIELHHHLVDGRESDLMDWPVTESYTRELAKAFGLRIYMSWRVGGIEREMLRNNSRTAPVAFEIEDGSIVTMGGDRGDFSTRMKFPQVSADLKVRWCSSNAKIDVFARLINNQDRFLEGRTLVVTGERAEESTSRANYLRFERHRTDNRDGTKVRRYVDHYRPVHHLLEGEVWALLEKHRVNPHPAYWLGFSRLSCRQCIFGNADQWATIRTHMPHSFIKIANYEQQFGVTIHRSRTVNEQADRGTPYPCSFELLQLAESTTYTGEIFVDNWVLPPGAFKHSGGPT